MGRSRKTDGAETRDHTQVFEKRHPDMVRHPRPVIMLHSIGHFVQYRRHPEGFPCLVRGAEEIYVGPSGLATGPG